MRYAAVLCAVLCFGCDSGYQPNEFKIGIGINSSDVEPFLLESSDLWNKAGANIVVVRPGDRVDGQITVATIVPHSDWPYGSLGGFGGPTLGIQIDELVWTEAKRYNPQYHDYLLDLVAHEMGHFIGCGHVSSSDSVMYPTIHPQTTLSTDDVSCVTLKTKAYP